MTHTVLSLKTWRIARGLTQAELGKLAGEDQRTISRIEAGITKDPGFCSVRRICRALKVSPERVAEFRCE